MFSLFALWSLSTLWQFQTMNGENIGGGYIFQELHNPSKNVLREIKYPQELITTKNRTTLNKTQGKYSFILFADLVCTTANFTITCVSSLKYVNYSELLLSLFVWYLDFIFFISWQKSAFLRPEMGELCLRRLGWPYGRWEQLCSIYLNILACLKIPKQLQPGNWPEQKLTLTRLQESQWC